jgi:hypothetical protein
VLLDQALHEGEPDAQAPAGPFKRPVDLEEHVEDPWEGVGRDADPVVLHHDHDFIVLHVCRKPDISAFLGVLGAVREQVAEHLGQPGQVAVQIHRIGRKGDGELVSGRVDGLPGRLHGAFHDVGKADRGAPEFHLVLAEPGDVEEVVHEANQVLQLAFHDAPGLGHGVRVRSREAHQLQAAPERGEGVSEFVGQERDEPVLVPVGFAKNVLHFPPLRDVARRPRHGLHLPVRSEDRHEEVIVDPSAVRPLEGDLAPDRDAGPPDLVDLLLVHLGVPGLVPQCPGGACPATSSRVSLPHIPRRASLA